MKELSRRLMDGLGDLAGLDMILAREVGSDRRESHQADTGERTTRGDGWWGRSLGRKVGKLVFVSGRQQQSFAGDGIELGGAGEEVCCADAGVCRSGRVRIGARRCG